MEWLNYTDPVLGFSLTYPNLYTVLKEPASYAEIAPNLLGRFRLLEPSLAESAFAELEPPKFSLEVYSNAEKLSLTAWLDKNSRNGDSDSIQIDGIKCSKVTQKTLMAPNQFIYCIQGDKIYQFIPLGLYAEQILASFKFGAQ